MTELTNNHHKVFYGWWIVGAIFLISAYIGGFIFYSFTAILEPIADELGWSYTQVSIAASMRGLQNGLLAPVVGLLIDRIGPRKPVIAGIIVTGIGLVLLGRSTNLAVFYGAFFLLSAGMSSCTGVLPMAVVGNWFRRRVSIATAIAISGTATGGLLVVVATRMIDIMGWRDAMLVLGAGAWVILLPLTIVIRHKPEQYGYLPDGDTVSDTAAGITPELPVSVEKDTGVKEALKSRVFWHISLGLSCHVLGIMAVLTHIMPYLTTIGIDRTVSSLVASAIPVVSIGGRLSYGWLGDRYDKRWVTVSGLVFTAIGLLLLGLTGATATWLLVPFVISFGIGFGGPIPMTSALLREYFGRARLGTIIGIAMGVMMVGNMLGPPMAAWIFDSSGSYQGAWFGMTGLLVAGIIIMLTAPSVRKDTETGINL